MTEEQMRLASQELFNRYGLRVTVVSETDYVVHFTRADAKGIVSEGILQDIDNFLIEFNKPEANDEETPTLAP